MTGPDEFGGGVATFNARSGIVTLTKADVTATGLAAGDVDAQPADAYANYLAARASSPVSTGPRTEIGVSSVTAGSGTENGALAICAAAGTYTKIRFCTGATITALTKVLIGVFDNTGTPVTDTGDISGTVTAPNTLYDNINLSAPVTLTLGQALFLAATAVGTTFTVTGIALRAQAIGALAPIIARSRSGYVSGSMLALTSPSGSIMPWIELVP